jgi:hypothetical protein
MARSRTSGGTLDFRQRACRRGLGAFATSRGRTRDPHVWHPDYVRGLSVRSTLSRRQRPSRPDAAAYEEQALGVVREAP